MARITRTDRHQTFDPDGNLVSDVEFVVDITEEVNEAHVDDRLTQAIAANKTYLALASPTNAQNVTQIRSTTRQLIAIEKKLLRDLDDTDGT